MFIISHLLIRDTQRVNLYCHYQWFGTKQASFRYLTRGVERGCCWLYFLGDVVHFQSYWGSTETSIDIDLGHPKPHLHIHNNIFKLKKLHFMLWVSSISHPCNCFFVVLRQNTSVSEAYYFVLLWCPFQVQTVPWPWTNQTRCMSWLSRCYLFFVPRNKPVWRNTQLKIHQMR